MTWLVLDSFLVMLACFAIGALAAWLLAAVLYPTRRDLGLRPRPKNGRFGR